MKAVISGAIGLLITVAVVITGYADANVATDNQATDAANIAAYSTPNTPNEEAFTQPAANEVPTNEVSAVNTSNTPSETMPAAKTYMGEPPPLPEVGSEPVAPVIGEAQPGTVENSAAVEPTTKEPAERIATLEVQNNALQIQLTQLSARLDLLEKELMVIKQKSNGGVFGVIQQQADSLEKRVGSNVFMVIISVVILVALLLLGYIIMPRRKKTCAANCYSDSLASDDRVHYEDNEGEHTSKHNTEDRDECAAKLNLARAYVEMGEKEKAETILHEVLSCGSADEQKEAKELLDKVSTPSAGS